MGLNVAPLGGDDGDEDGGYQPLAEINITPFVDVMLVLLVIFMVAAPLMVAGVPVDLPNSSAAKLSQPKKPVIVTLKDNGLFLRKIPVAQGSLVATLRKLRATEGDTIVYVRADRTRPYGEVMELLGRVGESGYQRISLLSQPKPADGALVFDTPASRQ